MKILKTLAAVFATDLLSLFIGLTLAFSSNIVLRIISSVCTCGILICILGSFAFKTAYADVKEAVRKGDRRPSHIMPFIMGIFSSVPAIISWLILKFSDIDFYRWHKLINGYFLQIFNFINPNASSDSLTESQIWSILPFSLAPAVVFIICYYISFRIYNKGLLQ